MTPTEQDLFRALIFIRDATQEFQGTVKLVHKTAAKIDADGKRVSDLTVRELLTLMEAK